MGGSGCTYLLLVHLEFPQNFDGNLAVLIFCISGSVDCAEGTLSHLFK